MNIFKYMFVDKNQKIILKFLDLIFYVALIGLCFVYVLNFNNHSNLIILLLTSTFFIFIGFKNIDNIYSYFLYLFLIILGFNLVENMDYESIFLTFVAIMSFMSLIYILKYIFGLNKLSNCLYFIVFGLYGLCFIYIVLNFQLFKNYNEDVVLYLNPITHLPIIKFTSILRFFVPALGLIFLLLLKTKYKFTKRQAIYINTGLDELIRTSLEKKGRVLDNVKRLISKTEAMKL